MVKKIKNLLSMKKKINKINKKEFEKTLSEWEEGDKITCPLIKEEYWFDNSALKTPEYWFGVDYNRFKYVGIVEVEVDKKSGNSKKEKRIKVKDLDAVEDEYLTLSYSLFSSFSDYYFNYSLKERSKKLLEKN